MGGGSLEKMPDYSASVLSPSLDYGALAVIRGSWLCTRPSLFVCSHTRAQPHTQTQRILLSRTENSQAVQKHTCPTPQWTRC